MVSDISATLGLSEIKILFLPIEWMYLTPAFIGTEIKVILKYLLEERKSQNTAQIIRKCQMPFANITEAICNFFSVFYLTYKVRPGF